MNAKIFFDTNLLVYLYSEDELEKQAQILTPIKDTENRWISTQVLNELSNTLRRKFKLEYADIANVIAEIRDNFEIITVQIETIERALKIAEKYRYSYYDSVIIAAALESSCTLLYSEDMQHNQIIEGQLQIINPFKQD
ncbi:MAG: PIN domain-containing protein [Methylococcales bacterium]|nr:PIN domain-containing protein [Methylococcales bacterium]